MRTETLEEITGLITSLDSDGLNKLIPIIKSHRNTLASMKKTQLSIGDRVSLLEKEVELIKKNGRLDDVCVFKIDKEKL